MKPSKAQQVADKLNTFLGGELGNEAAALLRAQDTLLQQALEALDCSYHDVQKHDMMYAAAEAITEHLK